MLQQIQEWWARREECAFAHPTVTCADAAVSIGFGKVTRGQGEDVRRKLAALIVLASVAFATTAAAQNRAAAPLPAAQGVNEKSLVAKAQAALDARQWPDAEAALKPLVSSEPRWEYFEALGNAQSGQGHSADSIASYQRALDLAQNKATPAATGRIWTMIGNANLKLKKNDAAIAAYNTAAALDPNPAVAYFNICATLYNAGETVKTLTACDKAIAADPKKADAYFIKGSVMVGQGNAGKDGKMVVPPGTVETLKQYLVLAPDGGHASDVKQMLDFLK
jgi:tetratricopeptide (TPR) repeat protein